MIRHGPTMRLVVSGALGHAESGGGEVAGRWWLLWKKSLCGARAVHSEEPCQAADRGRQEPFEVQEREMPSPTPREEQLYSPALDIWILNKHLFMEGVVTH